MALIRDYFCKTKELEEQYGKKSIVLMQVGTFYEVYGYKDIETGMITGSNIEKFASICDFSIANKITGVVMAGFPEYVLSKHTDKLQKHGYTCAIYSQDSNRKNTTRSLDIICSPGTHFSTDATQLSNNIMCVWLFNHPPNRLYTKARIIFGLSTVDILTGSSHYDEICEEYDHNPSTYNEIERYYSIHQPNEILFVFNSNDIETTKINTILQYIGVNNTATHIIDLSDNEQFLTKCALKCEKQTYQVNIFQQFYEITDICAFMETNRFNEYHIGCRSFCFLLDFIYAHNPNLLYKIQYPSIEVMNNNLRLANHSLRQLNILNDTRSTGKTSSVVNLVNCALTPMGKRETKRQILHPVINIEWLQEQYHITQHILSNMDEFVDLQIVLRAFNDIPRYYRKIVLRKLTPSDCSILYNNIQSCKNLLQRTQEDNILHTYLPTQNLQVSIDTLLNRMNTNLDLEVCGQTTNLDIKSNIFKRGVHPNIDELYKKYVDAIDKFKAIQTYFSHVIIHAQSGNRTIKGDPCKIHTTDKSGGYLKVSKSRADKLQQCLPTKHKVLYVSTYTGKSSCFILNCAVELSKATGTDKRISNEQIDKIAFSILKYKQRMQDAIKEEYEKWLSLLQTYDSEIICVSDFITEVDVIFHKAYVAHKYNYCAPVIDESTKTAFINATQMRHALIEQFQMDEVYVPNDIQLGISCDEGECDEGECDDTSSHTNGVLLYGTNAVGKSCLIKSIGICVILAQSGFFVPCTSFQFHPFHHIFTRLLGNDNIFKGLSTFAVEMTELNTILRHSTKQSLILGDELCSGTELGSAISIFSAGLIQLSQNKSKFIFASHFHEIASMKQITDIQTLAMKHMSVSYDTKEDYLIYDRILKDGPGSNNYGLEVCKSLHLPRDFIELAHSIRVQEQPEMKSVLMNSVSHFNASKVHGKCELCKRLGVEVHHLQYQKNADSRGFFDTFHKNTKGNLMNICESCHIKMHSSSKQYRRKKTSKGNKILEA